MNRRRNNSGSSIAPAFIFFMIAIFSKTPVFFLFAMFFFVRHIMATQKSQGQQRQQRQHQDRRRQTQRRDPRSRSEPAQRPQRQNKSRSNPFKKTGIQKYKEFEMDGAIEDFKQGLAIDPRDVALHFNIAAAYSLTEDKDKAFHHISEAVKYGFKDFEKINTHDDLAYLRIQPEFDDFKENGYVLSREKREIPVKEEEVTDDVLLSQLNKLAEMRKKGLLSNDEFVLEKEKLLRQ